MVKLRRLNDIILGFFLACPLLIGLSALLIAILTVTQVVPVQSLIVTLVLVLTCLSVTTMVIFFGPMKSLLANKVYFYLVVMTCMVLAGGWLGGALT